MTRDTCRYPPCDRAPGDEEGYDSRRFCSQFHELKYDHIRADARDARMDAERDAEECR